MLLEFDPNGVVTLDFTDIYATDAAGDHAAIAINAHAAKTLDVQFDSELNEPFTITIGPGNGLTFGGGAVLGKPAIADVFGIVFYTMDRSGGNLIQTIAFVEQPGGAPATVTSDLTTTAQWTRVRDGEHPTAKTITAGAIVLTFATPNQLIEDITCDDGTLITATGVGAWLPTWTASS